MVFSLAVYRTGTCGLHKVPTFMAAVTDVKETERNVYIHTLNNVPQIQ